jgi:hypothetical protein
LRILPGGFRLGCVARVGDGIGAGAEIQGGLGYVGDYGIEFIGPVGLHRSIASLRLFVSIASLGRRRMTRSVASIGLFRSIASLKLSRSAGSLCLVEPWRFILARAEGW